MLPSAAIISRGHRWPVYSFAVVFAVDRSRCSAVTTFGTGGVQTIGNPLAPDPNARQASEQYSVDPFGLAIWDSTFYVVGECTGTSPGIGRQGTIFGGFRGKAFVAVNAQSGSAAAGLGQNGVLSMEGGAFRLPTRTCWARRFILPGDVWRNRPQRMFLLRPWTCAMRSISQQFGTAGVKVLRPWVGQGGASIRANGQVLYIAGYYSDRTTAGVFVAAFDRKSGLPLTSFGNRGVQLIEGLTFGQQGQIEPYGDTLFLVARTTNIIGNEKREIKIGSAVFNYGEMSGLLVHLSKDGKLLGK